MQFLSSIEVLYSSCSLLLADLNSLSPWPRPFASSGIFLGPTINNNITNITPNSKGPNLIILHSCLPFDENHLYYIKKRRMSPGFCENYTFLWPNPVRSRSKRAYVISLYLPGFSLLSLQMYFDRLRPLDCNSCQKPFVSEFFYPHFRSRFYALLFMRG
jgi:hypothetical protein